MTLEKLNTIIDNFYNKSDVILNKFAKLDNYGNIIEINSSDPQFVIDLITNIQEFTLKLQAQEEVNRHDNS